MPVRLTPFTPLDSSSYINWASTMAAWDGSFDQRRFRAAVLRMPGDPHADAQSGIPGYGFVGPGGKRLRLWEISVRDQEEFVSAVSSQHVAFPGDALDRDCGLLQNNIARCMTLW